MLLRWEKFGMNDKVCDFFDNTQVPEPSALVIFGASGNLTAIKLFPALFHLYAAGRLSCNLCIIGFSRSQFSDEEFREKMEESVRAEWEKEYFQPALSGKDAPGNGGGNGKNIVTTQAQPAAPGILKDQSETGKIFPQEKWQEFARKIFYHSGNGKNPDDYRGLADRLKNICNCENLPENVLLYIATPPDAYHPIIENIEKSQFLKYFSGWSRIVVEKPFGTDSESSDSLNNALDRIFNEDQIYRIDHYLGKETVQNILIFRFANGIFEPIWNRRYIDHVQILIAEDIGVGKRGGYYENSGAFKDMVQNHMMQLLALTAMDPPVSFESDSIRDEKVKVIKSIRPVKCSDVRNITVRGQYSEGILNGVTVPGYRQEPGVSSNSGTETYAAVKVHLDNWRWAGVPFYLRTGKRLPRRVTEIAIAFKEAPHLLFQKTQFEHIDSNMLVLRIQPDEGIFMRFGVKIPGTELRIGNVNMDFSYRQAFHQRSISAYERLLLDFMMGDSSLYARRDGLKAMWKFADSITDGWKNCDTPHFPNYSAGTWGPEEAEEFIRRDGRNWRE